MFSFFNFTKGEWAASLFLITITVGILLFGQFYEYRAKTNFNVEQFENEIAKFIEADIKYSDSLKEAWEKRQKRRSYKSKEYTKYQNYKSLDTGKSQKWSISDKYTIVKVDLNHCDTAEVSRIPLFGSKRAAKLIEYREQLGGFYALEQIQEVYILQNVKIEHLEKYFKVNKSEIKKIAINKTTYEELIKHPYFDAYLTKSILYYRQKEGNIRSIEEFRRATNVYPELLQKVEPYLSFEE